MNRGAPKVGGRVSARLDEETADELALELGRTRMSESEYIRQCIRRCLGLSSIFDACPPMADNGGDIDPGT